MSEDELYVCPGCYAVGGEPCLPGCIDEEIRRSKEERREDDEGYDHEHYDESDEPTVPDLPPTERPP